MTETAKHSLDSASAESPNRPSKISKVQYFSDDEGGYDEELVESSVVTRTMSPNPRLQRYLVAIEYIGTRFSGSQKQLTCRTVVGVLEVISNGRYLFARKGKKKFLFFKRSTLCYISGHFREILLCNFRALGSRNQIFLAFQNADLFRGGGGGGVGGEFKQSYIDFSIVEYLVMRVNCVFFFQCKMQEAFHKFIGQPVSISLSSRTDAGVHALSNVCHVDVERISKRKPGEVLPPHEPAVVRRAVNHFLQKNEGDIMVIDVQCVPVDFHARFKAQERTYFYRLLSGPEPLSTFEQNRAWHVPEQLDLVAMQEACKILVGHHDFSSFRASGCQAKSPIRTLDELSVSEVASTPYFPSIVEREKEVLHEEESCCNNFQTDMASGSISDTNMPGASYIEDVGFGIRKRHRCYVVTARARSFLYHQVRLLVGALKSVGTGDLTVSDEY
ncbi:uncharacterized protein LOC110618616 isoform X2 [Manihot esculenta]|uniref:uncharacterized protein LOC110618616 isoform X2 n=1 Tax=Manihot esculenta TaxID=3983 RepID=UPI001CC35599|nr:uncharacterized protein LOC110618616 isoform X2 [Manihot esculenta]